ncbi:putative N-acetyltransferase YsnE [Roseobacter fucihabitans]|uniref:N-acetyltransferase YsnE n=1 Tax=Roseobacter fucihabitans TaxID=1537242 RepID=A0ABZ2BUT4_9RHOB|nr:GNAT family N-acetyltransferase [Roseobacter litoralis]MBC6966530.1 putative N-acetyltransferase YsnE [Roseobacter litoralis]
MGSVTIRKGAPSEPQATSLLHASHALMTRLFPSEANHFLSVEALAAPHISFFVAQMDEELVGCVALASYPGYGEIKSMFVSPSRRKQGIADALLSAVIAQARDANLPCIRLETGTGLEAAHRLYERHGFHDCDAFGSYLPDAPLSRYMELAI